MSPREECRAELQPFIEALKGLKKIGYRGITRIQTVEWPLAGNESRQAETIEIVLELKKEILQ
jgi:hypothetical protein